MTADDNIQALRDSGDCAAALRKLLELFHADTRDDRRARIEPWQQHIAGPQCLLLDVARSGRDRPADTVQLLEKFQQDEWVRWLVSDPGFHADPASLPKLLDARLACLKAALGCTDTDPGGDANWNEVAELIRQAIRLYSEAWAYQPTPASAQLGKQLTRPPAFLAELNPRWRHVFQTLASETPPGWLHPALLLAGESVASVWSSGPGGPRAPTAGLPPDAAVHTWILFAGTPRPGAPPSGMLARLTIQRLPGGCGALYPHPQRAGYLQAVDSFQTGLQNALYAAVAHRLPGCTWDFRWSLEPARADEFFPIGLRITGRSAEAAVACAIRALIEGERLDQHVAVTAQFESPGQPGESRLTAVGSIDEKLLAPGVRRTAVLRSPASSETPGFFSPGTRMHNDLLAKQIDEVLVADDQPEVTGKRTAPAERPKIGNGEVELVPVRDLDQAYQHLASGPRWTDAVRQQLAARADVILAEQCGTYVRSALSKEDPSSARVSDPAEMADRRSPAVPDPAGPRDRQRRPLSEDAIDRITRGELSEGQHRVVLFADSGLGKSMFLVHCERQIATAPAGRLPVRLGGGPLPRAQVQGEDKRLPLLSEIEWKVKPGAVLENLADRLLHRLLPPEVTDQQCWQWFATLVRRGQVVFLCDALDQTRAAIDALGSFLESAGVARCPVLLTGRPETRQTRGSVLQHTSWQYLHVEPFDEPRQREFLGPLADQLLPTGNEGPEFWQDQAGYERKRGWADLLGVPLLLHLLRDLAVAGKLENVPNRQAVYDQSVRHLVQKGWETLKNSESQGKLLSLGMVDKVLGEIAWRMVAADNFEGVLQGEPFDELLLEPRYQNVLQVLHQIDITTLQSVLDNPGETCLAWRHRSFCEYFGGLRLAELDRAEQEEVAQQHARDPNWNWVFRFALSRLASAGRGGRATPGGRGAPNRGHALARDLIRFGNPFLVYEAIDRDHVQLENSLDGLCRWLVHRDFGDRDYTDAWDGNRPRPAVTPDVLSMLETLLDRTYRDSRCLHPAWELLESASDPRAAAIRQRFLGEFRAILDDPAHPDHATAAALALQGFVRCPQNPAEDRRPFLMGSPEGVGENDERPQHEVMVSPFAMLATPVTNRQFELFDASHRALRTAVSPEDDCPVIYVSWYMAVMFCKWLGAEYRLPTEAEWEYACRAGSTGQYCFGDDVSELGRYAWYDKNAGSTTHPVGQKKPNAWGLYDVHGNVWEWCADWYGEKYYARSPRDNPTGPEGGSNRVNRGGGWWDDASRCRASYRYRWGDPGYRGDNLGFRLVRTQCPCVNAR